MKIGSMRSDEPAVWRVVSEFVSSDFLRREGHTSDDQVWMGLVRGARVTDPSVVKVAVEKLVDELHETFTRSLRGSDASLKNEQTG
jgi:hypothetical protein